MRRGGRRPEPVTRTELAALATLLLAGGTAGAEPAATPERSTPVVQGELGRKLDLYLSRLEALGYSGGLAVVKGGETVLLKGYGQADREGGVPMRPDSVFNLGSITKPFTAAAILRLQELGKLKTSDPVSRFFDGVPGDKAGITLEHLLTHSSGLESDFSPTDYEATTREEYVRRALASKLLFPPGEGYEYANAGYSLLAAIVEQTERAGLRDGPRRDGAEARRHDGDRLQGPALGRGAHRPRLPRRRGLGHDPRPHRGARRTVLGAAGQRRPPHDARRHGALERRATGKRRPQRGLPRELRPPASGRGSGSAVALRLRLGGREDAARHTRAAQRRQRHLRGRAAEVRGRGRHDLPRLDRRGAEGDTGRAGPHRDRLRRAVRPAAGRRHALPRGPARPRGPVPRDVGRGGRRCGSSTAGSRSRPPSRSASLCSPACPRPSASGTSGWERAPRTSRGGRSRATRPASTRPSAGAWAWSRFASRRPS